MYDVMPLRTGSDDCCSLECGRELRMSLKRKVSFRLYCLILLTLAPLLVYWIVSGNNHEDTCNHMVQSTNHHHGRLSPVPKLPASSFLGTKTKTILYWTKLWESDNMDFGNGNIFASCPVWNCMATNNRSALAVKDFDVIMFHAIDVNPNDLPKERSPHQRYIFLNLETQIFHPFRYNKIYDNFFNWTMTYRRDSTLMRSYGVVKTTDTNEYIPPYIPVIWKDVSAGKVSDMTRNKVRGKTKLVSWFVSNCDTFSKRELYVKALKQHLSVDIFGECGPLKCNQKETDCFEMVERDYYFYLALENSLCKDYITEKAFKFLQYDVVPIVYGAADYATTLPPGSYIDIRDFASPEELADYLWAVSEDSEKYLNFFKWKTYFKVEIRPEHYTVCDLCKRLHEVSHPPMVIEDIYGWWVTNQCSRNPTFKGLTVT